VNLKAIPGMCLLLAGVVILSNARAQSNNYTQTNLVSNVPGLALTVDDDLVHPWGMDVSANKPFRIAANGKGKFKSYDANGAQQDPRGVIAVPDGVTVAANPTGVAANTTGLFVPPSSLSTPFLFATRQGTISTEYADDRGDIKTTTILVVNHSSQGAEYTGLAVLTPDCCAPYLAVADFHRGYIETFTSFFDPLGIVGAFTDDHLPVGYAPWNLSVVDGKVFVAYAIQNAAQHDPVVGAGNGIVDIYNLDGSFVKRFVTNEALNVPSGIVKAGADFGAFSNAILIGNFGDGLINAFDPNTGQLLGVLKDGNGNPIVNLQLHSMVFGDGSTGNANRLYLTAALTGGVNGIFASVATNTSGAGPDFTLSASPSTVTVSAGQAASYSIKVAPVGNFRGGYSISCNAPTIVTCTVGSQSIDPVTGSATVTVTATQSSATRANAIVALLFPGFLLIGLGNRKRRRSISALAVLAIGLLVVTAVGVTGCGSSKGSGMIPQTTTQSLSITATSASVTHTTLLTLQVQ
jgi:uncharacterized protein (TIGR03118 family)